MDKARRLKDLAELRKATGLELPGARPTAPAAGRAQVMALLDFAVRNLVVFNPVGYGYYVDAYNHFGHCPCDATRKACPCGEAVVEVWEKGCCKCQLFWKDYETYRVKKGLKDA